MQYGRKIDYVGAANQVVTLRVPAGMFSTVSLQALVSSLGSNAWFALDVGNTGGDHWNGWVANAGEYTSPDLATQFNAYWASQGSPTAGTLDVPVRVYLDRPGQILLTNLQVQTSCSALRRVRLTARNYASATLNLTVGGSGSPLVTLAADVGDNGSIDWTWSATSSLPRALDTTNLADAVNAYLSGQTGEVDVPIRFFVSPASSSLTLNSFAATLSQQPDLAAGAPSFSAVSPVEASAVTVTAVVSNTGGVESSGAVASFFAAVAGWPDTYIGSTFVPGLPAGAANQASIAWNTLGFTGSVPVRVVIDPYNRLAETSEANNVVTSTLTIRSRPDLRVISFTLSNDEPVVGERVTVTLRIQNAGQTNAPAGNHALYLGNPDSGGGLIASRTAAVGAGAATNLAYTWIPTGTGPVRLYARLDRNNQVNEFDKGNNDAWIDRYVGFAGARRIDSGNPVSDTLYTPAAGYGAVDAGAADQRLNCGSSPDLTYRLDPNGKVGYRFDHLQPGHFYHLDLVLYECGQNAGRQERVKVDGNLVGGPYDLGGGATHRLSFLVDPALYATDRSISVTVEENGGLGAVVNFIALHDVDYRYADAGGGSDPQFPGLRGYGWLDANSAAVSSCGALPYQTSRVNQTAATLRYRWDNLTPAKRYRLNFTFYQCTGANMQQHILADGQVLGADLFIPANTLVTATRSVPKSAYLGDGSLIVSVARQNASVGALVSEVALEEETSVAPASCDGLVRSTPYWTQAYGAVTVTGQLAPAGSLVTAEDPRSNVVGCFVVNTAGQYGLMSIYGEDAAAAPGVGMRADETVLFRVDGALAVGTPPLKWRNDSNFHLVDLDAGATAAQPIVLATGWNLPSFRVEPPVPLVDTVLRSIAGKYCRVLGEGGAYDCRVPAQYRSLKELRAGRGYYLHITHTASLNLLVEGVTVPPTRPISLHPGWNWIGYLPAVAMPVTVALQTVAGKYQRVVDGQGKAYVPALPQFSTLSRMEPGLGYLIYATAAATLVYPASPPVALAGVEEAGADAQPAACALTQPTPYFTLLYGRLTVNGAPAPAGTRIEAITTDGRTVGCALTRDGGEFGLMPVFGADEAILPGYAEGRLIVLRVDGARLAETGIAWSDDKSPHVVDVAAGPAQLRLPIVTRP